MTKSPHHRTLAELTLSAPYVTASPRDRGSLQLIVRRPRDGEREVLDIGELDPRLGLVGDNWSTRRSSRTADGSPHPDMQINLMNARAADLLAGSRDRWPLAGDQLYVDLDLAVANLPPGTRLAVGAAILEITSQPHTGCKKFAARFGADALRWVESPSGRELRLRGANARVVRGGPIRSGDVVHKV